MTSHISFRSLLLVSALLRVGLVLYSDWHDAHSVVKYTDVDYRVFSDATRFLLHPSVSEDNVAQGLWGKMLSLGDPYTRETYRYTPLLAILLAPNEWLHPSFGKYLFAACDIIAGVLLYQLLVEYVLPNDEKDAAQVQSGKADSTTSKGNKRAESERYATLLTALHLLNPMVFTISTRGSSEAVLLLLVLASLMSALRARWTTTAVLIGLSTHWKIYPLVYGAACVGVIGGQHGKTGLWRYVNVKTVRFGCIAVATFAALCAAMYGIWGYPFLYESYLYHLHRRDHRHNFSPYFYLAYLTYPASADYLAANGNAGSAGVALELSRLRKVLQSPLVSFVPQMTLALGTGLAFGRRSADLPFTWFVQTFTFVVFNKVCTSQYFLWYLVFVPLFVPRLKHRLSVRQAVALLAVWAGTQALWLSQAYRLEFKGDNVFLILWACGIVYAIGNCWVLGELIKGYVRKR